MSNGKENRIALRITEAEFEELKKAAEQDDRSVSSFVRYYSLKAAREEFGLVKSLAKREQLLAKQEELLDREIKLEQLQHDFDRGVFGH
jgi:uncharacterized protein (DUF1778 family)